MDDFNELMSELEAETDQIKADVHKLAGIVKEIVERQVKNERA